MTNGLVDQPGLENPFRVKLNDRFGGRVAFEVTPDLTESRQVNYNSIEPTHLPGSIQIFKNSSSRTFQVSGARFLSRTPQEADRTIKRLWVLRSWGTPRFGSGSSTLSVDNRYARVFRETDPNSFLAAQENQRQNPRNSARDYSTGVELLGAPPNIVFLSAYSDQSTSGVAQNIYKVPTVMTNLTIPYPSDVDYVLSTAGVPVPIVMSIDVSLTETHSPAQYEQFSLGAFKNGRLSGF